MESNYLASRACAVKIAVIVPIYNVEEYLPDCLDSLLNQTHQNWLAFLVDDGSTDSSGQIADQYAAKDSRFITLHTPNRGLGAARNKGLDLLFKSNVSDLSLLAFLDSDDILMPQAYGTISEVFRRTQADIIFHGYSSSLADGTQTQEPFFIPSSFISRESYINAIFSSGKWADSNGKCGFVWSRFFKPSLLQNIRFCEDRNTVEDELFCISTLNQAKRIYFEAQNLYVYRQRSNSQTRTADMVLGHIKGSLGCLSKSKGCDFEQHAKQVISTNLCCRLLNHCHKSHYVVSQIRQAGWLNFCARQMQPFAHRLLREGKLERSTCDYIDCLTEQKTEKLDWEDLDNDSRPRLVVSLTSHPKRIKDVTASLRTILSQTQPVNEIVLWLGSEQFPNRLSDIPEDLAQLIKSNAVHIRWCTDIGPHTKYFYAFTEYKNDIVITVDDDILYPCDLVENLYRSYLRYPKAISAIRVRLIATDECNEIKPFHDWPFVPHFFSFPSSCFFAEGTSGVLYPPGLLSPASDLLDPETILRTCWHNDDLWLKAMQLAANIPVVVAGKNDHKHYIDGTQDYGLWATFNAIGGTDIELEAVVREFDNRYGDGAFGKRLTMCTPNENLAFQQLFQQINTAHQAISQLQAELHRSTLEIAHTRELLDHWNKMHSLLPLFRVSKYLKYRILSKLTFGEKRRHYKQKYQKQKRIYQSIKKGFSPL